MELQINPLPSSRIEDLTDRVFGKWTVLGYSHREKSSHLWIVRCECGTVKRTQHHSLTGGKSKSCGCRDRSGENASNYRHGHKANGKPSAELSAYRNMLSRCTQPKNNEYQRYGARGIAVCDRWRLSFEAFLEDMGPRPSKDHGLDRIDNQGNYEKANCRWATRAEQNRNRRTNVWITWNGETLCQKDWARRFNLRASQFKRRLQAWDFERAMTTVGAVRTTRTKTKEVHDVPVD